MTIDIEQWEWVDGKPPKAPYVPPDCNAPITPKCKYTAISHGLCNGHRMQKAKGRPFTPLRRRRSSKNKKAFVVSVWVDDKTHDGLEKLATHNGTSIYALVLEAAEKLAKTARNLKTQPPTGS